MKQARKVHKVIKSKPTREGAGVHLKRVFGNPEYLDVSIPANAGFTHPTKKNHTVFAYVIDGKGHFDLQKDASLGNGTLCLFDDGDHVAITTEQEPVRFLLISGKPIGEPVAWYGPIVMNTEEELELAFKEYRNGTFIKRKKP
jgi:quercetin 2,3-dioxygenase